MSNWSTVIRCGCCRRRGQHEARGLIKACYDRHRTNGTLAQFPRLTQAREVPEWTPRGSHGEQMLDRYVDLERRGFSARRIAWQLGIGVRQVQRYKAEAATRREQLLEATG